MKVNLIQITTVWVKPIKMMLLPLIICSSLIVMHGQIPFEPIPQELASKYHFDLSRNFFATPEAEEASRAILSERLKKFSQFRGKTGLSANYLLAALREYDALQTLISIHSKYLYLRYAMDTRNSASLDASAKLNADVNSSIGFFSAEMMTLGDAKLSRFLAQKPELKVYAFAIKSLQRYREHTLTPQQEEITSALAPSLLDWQSDLFSQTLANTDFGTVQTPQGELNLRNNARDIFNNAERLVRETGFKQNRAALASRRDTYAFALIRTVTARNRLAQFRRFSGYPAEAYFDLYLTQSDVSSLLERLAQFSQVNKRFEQLRVEHIKRTAGYQAVHPWDLNVTPPGAALPRFTIGEAARVIEAAMSPLGAEYNQEMESLLNPANGRLDIAPAGNRVNRPGFSSGGTGSPSVFYSGGFQGYLDDVIILAHEGGHAVQSMMMNNNGILPGYTAGPNFFTESFAGFNELLLLDYLYKTAPDRIQKIYFLERFLDQATEIFKASRESMVEQQIYDGVAQGKIRTADDIESLMQATGSRFSIWYGAQSERPMEWVNVIHYYTRPAYRINYVYSKLLALNYFYRYTREQNQFVPEYLKLLKNGYDAPPDDLLRKFINTDTHDPRLVEEAVNVINLKTAELDELYKN